MEPLVSVTMPPEVGRSREPSLHVPESLRHLGMIKEVKFSGPHISGPCSSHSLTHNMDRDPGPHPALAPALLPSSSAPGLLALILTSASCLPMSPNYRAPRKEVRDAREGGMGRGELTLQQHTGKTAAHIYIPTGTHMCTLKPDSMTGLPSGVPS